MNEENVKLEQNPNDKVEQKPESVVQVSESQNESKRKAKLEQDRLLREERLNASGNDRLVRELQKNEISRVKPVKKKRTKTKKTPPLRNEKGIKLNKDGTEDKRSANFYNGPLYKSILARKKEVEETPKKKVVYTPIVESDSDTDVEFEIELMQPVSAPAPTPLPVEQHNGTNEYLKKQEAEREKMLSEQIKAMELENKKLKDDFHFNSHLNRISLSARNMKLKF